MDGSNEDEEEMEEEEEGGDQVSEVDRAKAVAEAFGKSSNTKSSSMEVDEVAAAMKELDMDNYDEEDDGTFVHHSVLSLLVFVLQLYNLSFWYRTEFLPYWFHM